MFQLVDHFYGAENRIDFFAVVGKHDTFFVYQARAIRGKNGYGNFPTNSHETNCFVSKSLIFNLTTMANNAIAWNDIESLKNCFGEQSTHNLISLAPGQNQYMDRFHIRKKFERLKFRFNIENMLRLANFVLHLCCFWKLSANFRKAYLHTWYGSNQDVDDKVIINTTNKLTIANHVEQLKRIEKKISARGVLCLSRAHSLL